MPFAKRIVEPQLLCRHQIPNDEGLLFEDLCAISHVVLSRTLRQLSDLARHACSLFQELENDIMSTNQRVWVLQNKIGQIQQTANALDPKKEAVPVSNLDIESKLSAHYQAPWHQQHNVFHPCTRPPCLEELHRNARLSLRALHRGESNIDRNRVTISISVAPPMPTFPSPHSIRRQQRSRLVTSIEKSESSEVIGDQTASNKAVYHSAPSAQDKQANWSKENVPPSDQKTNGDSQAVSSCIIPINVTGVGFDREASARCSLVHSQSVLQRRRKLRRRKTITGIPKRVQQDMDSDESPVARERTVIIHANSHQLSLCQEDLSISGRLHHTRDSGCQTDDFLIASAPSRRRIRAQRNHQGIPASLSHSTGNISSLGDQSDSTYTTASTHGGRLRSRSLPREGGQDFIPSGPSPRMKMMMMKDEEESTDDQAAPESSERDRGGGGAGSPEHSWMERGRSRLPRKADMGSCEISSSSDTFSSPIHSVSTTGVLGSHVDHKEDHQSSSGNWSGSSSTCPSQTSETIPPPSSPPLTGSSHCDSELSLNTAPNAIDEGFSLDPSYHSDLRPQSQGHRSSSFTSSATDQLDDAGVSTASEGEWTYPQDQDQTDPDQDQDPTQKLSENHQFLQEYSSMEGLNDQTCFSKQKTNAEKEPESHYPSDTEGFYSSSVNLGEYNPTYREYTCNYADLGPDCHQSNTVAKRLSHGGYPQPPLQFKTGTMTLGRTCRPLRKSKIKPPPPKRTSSLKETNSSVDVGTDTQADKDHPKMVSEQELTSSSTDMKLELDLELGGAPEPLQSSCLVAESLGTWGMGLGGAMDIVEPMSFSSADTHSFKDEGAVQSDYADLWLHNSELKSNNGEYASMSNSSTATGTTVMDCMKSPDSSSSSTETQIQAVAQTLESKESSPSLPSGDFKLGSPEKLAGLASPSSGYSSQSETPTSTLPSSSAAFFPGPLSPSTGKRKPKVPERKSSLSSLQQFPRDGASISFCNKRDPDFPPPPSQLDLNVLHGGSALTNPGSNVLPITPSTIRSVQLHSVSQSSEPQMPGNTTEASHPYLISDARTGGQEVHEEEREVISGATRSLFSFPFQLTLYWIQLHISPNIVYPPVHCRDLPMSKTHFRHKFKGYRVVFSKERSVLACVLINQTTRRHIKEMLCSTDSTPSDNSLSPLTDDAKVDDDIIITSPNKSRTTEDLFAMIHRSKRKVLGRKDSGDLNVKSRLCPVSAVTPSNVSTGVVPPAPPLNFPATLANAVGSQRAPVPIYRSAKKSSTSNEEFKLLLLKKGSRSDSSYRMSATEILKSPITPKTPGESLQECSIRQAEEQSSMPQEPPISGLDPIQIPGLFPRANSESFTPKTLPMSAASRQGRSRIPPVANSSRYSTRSRLYTAPMQAISEGETENSDGSPHDDRSS
uniref:Nance-Horan syndrome b (congenital cataracts and dental anomalies) n=1 Tax=Xiphophorus couchianus TaxID=32473 RepID=A0A3B5KRF4_9TELE